MSNGDEDVRVSVEILRREIALLRIDCKNRLQDLKGRMQNVETRLRIVQEEEGRIKSTRELAEELAKQLGLTPKFGYAFWNVGVVTLEDLVMCPRSRLLECRDIGPKSIKKLEEVLLSKGLSLSKA